MEDGFEKYGFPDGKRYNSFVGYFKRKYGERLQKIVLDAGFTCPNRDGKVGRGGCTYCDNAAFHPSYSTAYWPCSPSRAMPSFPSQLEWKIGLAWANTRGILNSPS